MGCGLREWNPIVLGMPNRWILCISWYLEIANWRKLVDKIAIITGVKGQGGSFLADLLVEKGYKVVGVERRSSSPDYSNIEHLFENPAFVLEQGDVTDFGSIARLIKHYKPTEFYNMAALSSPA